jgi:hypothetical protein
VTVEETKNALLKGMRKHSDFGASDSEGYHALADIERAMENGKPFPLRGDNPFQLYSSMAGWEAVSAELVELGRAYWKAGVVERLGL